MDPSDHLRHQERIREIISTSYHCHSFTTNFSASQWKYEVSERGGMLSRKTTLIDIMSPIVLFVHIIVTTFGKWFYAFKSHLIPV